MEPIIIVNFKTYASASGQGALELAELCYNVAENFNADVRLAVEAPDICSVASQVDIPVYAQHVDPVKPGSHTGWILAEAVRDAGAVGTLLNHSEHTLKMNELEACIDRARDVGLEVVACAGDSAAAEAVDAFNPDHVALEPPELIGGDTCVTDAQPELIRDAADRVESLLVGAGIKNGNDVTRSVELGARGVLLASGVVKADEPRRVVQDLVKGR